MRRQMTESLDIDLVREVWCCNRCGAELTAARENFKRGCLVYERDPRTVHRPLIEGTPNMAPDPEWCRIIEFCCPQCGAMLDCEYLPPGHPITHDLQPDIDALKRKYLGKET